MVDRSKRKNDENDPLNDLYVDVDGRIAIECMLCNSIVTNIVSHLAMDHFGNPVALKLLELIYATERQSE